MRAKSKHVHAAELGEPCPRQVPPAVQELRHLALTTPYTGPVVAGVVEKDVNARGAQLCLERVLETIGVIVPLALSATVCAGADHWSQFDARLSRGDGPFATPGRWGWIGACAFPRLGRSPSNDGGWGRFSCYSARCVRARHVGNPEASGNPGRRLGLQRPAHGRGRGADAGATMRSGAAISPTPRSPSIIAKSSIAPATGRSSRSAARSTPCVARSRRRAAWLSAMQA